MPTKKTAIKPVVIKRVFNTSPEMLWKAWTIPSVVKKWWGPKGFTAPSIKIDLKVGHKYIFCMRGPKGSPWNKNLYSAGIFKEIIPLKKLVLTDYFSDKNGNKVSPTEHTLSSDMPQEMTVMVKFDVVKKGKTKLSIIYEKAKTMKAYQAMQKSQMTVGWNQSLDKLEKAVK